jgi:rare lipoprotein A
MPKLNNLTAGPRTRSRTAVAVFAVTLMIGGTATEASAKSRHHHRHHQQVEAATTGQTPWFDANAAFGRVLHTFSGMASYYGNESGSRTASGQRFNQNAMTCAHRSLPFGTKLRVSHGGRSVVVTVNDRGPFIRGRVLDLSTGAARAIGLTSAGVGRVTAEVMS